MKVIEWFFLKEVIEYCKVYGAEKKTTCSSLDHKPKIFKRRPL